jgi:hypothetical protein
LQVARTVFWRRKQWFPEMVVYRSIPNRQRSSAAIRLWRAFLRSGVLDVVDSTLLKICVVKDIEGLNPEL